MSKCPKCNYWGNKWEFMKGTYKGAFSCPVCRYFTNNPISFKIKFKKERTKRNCRLKKR